MAPSCLSPSQSAPELGQKDGRRGPDRVRLQRLLTRAEGAGAGAAAQSEPRRPPGGNVLAAAATTQALRNPRPPGGTPFKCSPPVRDPGRTATTVGLSTEIPLQAGAGGERLATTASRRLGTGVPQTSGGAAAPPLTPRSQKAASQVQRLLGSTGREAQHWRLCQEVDVMDALLHDDKERHAREEAKFQNMRELQKQVEQARRLDSAARRSYCQWGAKLKADTDAFREEEHLKHLKSQEALKRHNEAQARHLEDLRHRRREAQLAEERIDQDMRQRAEAAKREQQEKEDKKKERQKQDAIDMGMAAKVAMEQKAKQKRAEAEDDLETMRRQKAMLEQQDRDRRAAFQAVQDKQKARQASYEAGAGNEIARKAKEDEERAKKCQEERHRKEEAEHQEKQRKLKQMQHEGNLSVARMLEEQAKRRQRDYDDDQRHREAAEREAAAANSEEKRKEQRRRELAKEHQDFLLQQMKQHPVLGKFGSEQMTGVEKSMNRDQLSRVQDESGLHMLFKAKQMQYHHTGKPV